MTSAKIALLADRGVVRVTGEDAEKLLQGIVSNDLDLLAAQPAIHAALLTPQGKILFDFFVVKTGDGYLLETGDQPPTWPSGSISTSCAPGRYPRRRRRLSRVGAVGPSPHISGGEPSAPSRSPIALPRWLAHPPKPFANDIAAATDGVDASRGLPRSSYCAGVPRAARDYVSATLSARGRSRPAQRRLLRQGLLRPPGGGEPHAEPSQRAQAVPIEGASPLTSRRDQGRRCGHRHHWLGGGQVGASADPARPSGGGQGQGQV
jgi:hypothetical protein